MEVWFAQPRKLRTAKQSKAKHNRGARLPGSHKEALNHFNIKFLVYRKIRPFVDAVVDELSLCKVKFERLSV